MSGMRYLTCIFCGRNIHLSRIRRESFESFSGDWRILQVREALPGPGRGRRIKGVGGFVIDPDRSLTISEMLESDEYRELALAVKRKLLLILEEYLNMGIVSRGEVEEILGRAPRYL